MAEYFVDELEEEGEGGGIVIRLKDFDGPFDALCHLIRKSKYSIEDVRISDITEQYMEYMTQLDELDMETATGFITMAAWLLEIKSKSLLPKPAPEQEEEIDSESELKQRLKEYSLLKEAAVKMREIETVDAHYRAPDDSVGEPRFVLKSMDISGLMGALQRVFLKLGQRAEEIKERHIVKDKFTVEEKIIHIMDAFGGDNSCSFLGLFDEESTKSEVITTFLAMLELLKIEYITVLQSEVFGDITLKKRARENDE